LSGFFIVEAKYEGVVLDDCLPQVLAQMYASGKKVRTRHIRGVLSNGYQWLFVILHINADGKGATYHVSKRTFSAQPAEPATTIPNVDLIAAMLSSWILHSFEDIGEDDFFSY
ncbi:hypothetical protein H0H93_001120, partial [Arthromyces matolae]